MAKTPKDESDWASLPVLTEIVGDAPPEIPVLIDEARNKQKLGQDDNIVEMSAEEIAELLAPQLEKQLRAKLSAEFEVMWQETWMQARASLPELIHAQLKAGGKRSALDIIAPRTAPTSTRKTGTGKTSSTKPGGKEAKNK